jgi:hypothetical protein
VAACAFGEHGVFAVQFHAQLEVFGRFAVFAHTHVAGGHAFDGTVVVVEHFRGGEAREDFHAEVFRLLGQPAREVAQADDVVAVVLRAFGQEDARGACGAGLGQEAPGVVDHGLVERGAQFFPVGKEFGQGLGVHDGARQDVRAGLAAFFQHHHRDVLAFFGGQLFQANCSGQAARAAADHDHVVFHGFAGTISAQNFFGAHERLLMKL